MLRATLQAAVYSGQLSYMMTAGTELSLAHLITDCLELFTCSEAQSSVGSLFLSMFSAHFANQFK